MMFGSSSSSTSLPLLSSPLRFSVFGEMSDCSWKLVMLILCFVVFYIRSYGEFTLGHRSSPELSVCPFLCLSLFLSSNSFMRFSCRFRLESRPPFGWVIHFYGCSGIINFILRLGALQKCIKSISWKSSEEVSSSRTWSCLTKHYINQLLNKVELSSFQRCAVNCANKKAKSYCYKNV